MLEITTEYAIKWFENRMAGVKMPGARAMYDKAIAALRAQQELEADRDAWKRRAEAAERDLGRFEACTTCKHDVDDGTPCEVCMGIDTGELGLRWNYYEWRGPCAENGGTEDGNQADPV